MKAPISGLLLVVLSAMSSGCTGPKALAKASSGWLGCPYQEIATADRHRGYFFRTWTASCGSRLWFCSTGLATTHCAPAADSQTTEGSGGAMASPAVGPACDDDRQCGNALMCVEGHCSAL